MSEPFGRVATRLAPAACQRPAACAAAALALDQRRLAKLDRHLFVKMSDAS
jgi:hypothetical protein